MKEAVKNYIEAYNTFNIDSMLVDLDENVIFESINNGETNLIIEGVSNFKQQAVLAATYFTTRHQEILEMKTEENCVTAKIHYSSILAKDLAENIKKGDEMNLIGTLTFYFNENNKIIKIEDRS